MAKSKVLFNVNLTFILDQNLMFFLKSQGKFYWLKCQTTLNKSTSAHQKEVGESNFRLPAKKRLSRVVDFSGFFFFSFLPFFFCTEQNQNPRDENKPPPFALSKILGFAKGLNFPLFLCKCKQQFPFLLFLCFFNNHRNLEL